MAFYNMGSMGAPGMTMASMGGAPPNMAMGSMSAQGAYGFSPMYGTNQTFANTSYYDTPMSNMMLANQAQFRQNMLVYQGHAPNMGPAGHAGPAGPAGHGSFVTMPGAGYRPPTGVIGAPGTHYVTRQRRGCC
eukprot:TRINITY_DN33027_c0_g1_i1.p2 TRINITY_DN33027_c0_g1~~TRINITY_DN33027_c0_g1_i1.p2  ORF type:complete len:133 (+),score=14.32 TRINITY_DN33027_c0_g1_i1:115-513(+)